MPRWPVDGQADALRLGKARAAGSTSKGRFAPAEEEGGTPPDGQAVALQSGKARAAGSASKGPFTLKRCKTDEALVLGLSKAQPLKQA